MQVLQKKLFSATGLFFISQQHNQLRVIQASKRKPRLEGGVLMDV